MRRISATETALELQGANPKKVPFADLKEHVRAPGDDPAVNKYKARIKNRATSIRAYCVECMGGTIADVRTCASIICPLHPFRMGKDPFRGWDLPKANDPVIEDDDDTGEFETGDEGSDADAI